MEVERSIEIPKTRSLESNKPQVREKEGVAFWLEKFVNPDSIKKTKKILGFQGASTEWIIYHKLLGVLIERGVELDPQKQNQLRNLIGTLKSMPKSTKTRKQRLVVSKNTANDLSWLAKNFRLSSIKNYDIVAGIKKQAGGKNAKKKKTDKNKKKAIPTQHISTHLRSQKVFMGNLRIKH